jgi:hypothetical protein
MEYLLLVLVLAAFGTVAVVIRHRRPTSFNSSVQAFERAREALAPEDWHPSADDPFPLRREPQPDEGRRQGDRATPRDGGQDREPSTG